MRPDHFRGAGECHDSRGVPIYPGDLLRTPHFTDREGRKHYLYHVACVMTCQDTGYQYIRMQPTSWLDPSHKRTGGDPILSDRMAADCEVIRGHGPGLYLDFDDRPKRQLTEDQHA